MPCKGEKRPEHFDGNPDDPQGMAVLAKAYLEALAVKGFSEQTLQLRRTHLNRIIRWAAERDVTRPNEVTRPMVERYQKYLSRTWYAVTFAGAELSKTGGCHLFRHSMATSMLENGADIRYIQAMLGHASLETTEIYTRVSIQKLRQIHDATHPTNRKPDVDDEDADASEGKCPDEQAPAAGDKAPDEET